MAIIGRASAVAEIGRLRFSGYFAWLAWLFVHLVELVEFQNKILVLVQWGWYYFSRNRAARLITRTAAPADVGCEDGKMKGTGANVRC
jgi:NADH dehydrogenase